jgi:hypothetical protein
MQLRDFQNQARVFTTALNQPPHHLIAGLTSAVSTLTRDTLDNTAAPSWSKTRARDALSEVLLRVSAIADAHDLDLNEIAGAALTTLAYHAVPSPAGTFFDDAYPDAEQLPRHISYEFNTSTREDGVPVTTIAFNGQQVGDALTDASARSDDYRLHDAFHLAYATHLGWSSVTRGLLGCKRRSTPLVDENEDGGRAVVIEEAAVAMVFSEAPLNDYYRNDVDPALLDRLVLLASPHEVAARRPADWRRAILDGYAMWHKLRENDGHGIVHADLLARTMTFQQTTASRLTVAQAG